MLSTPSLVKQPFYLLLELNRFFAFESSRMVNTTLLKSDTTNTDAELAESVYQKAHQHWTSIASNVDGMLGGFAQLHVPDVNGSRQFLTLLQKSNFLIKNDVALDCGSGIGRVTKHLLLPIFKRVDMVDFAESFIQKSKKFIGEKEFFRIGNQFVDSLHVFKPSLNTYDLIWIQWVTGQLIDNDFEQFLQNCKSALKRNGCIVIKDNIASRSEKIFDEEDHSWTRPKSDFYSIFRRAQLEVVLDRRQLNFPKGIYEVRMFALRKQSDKECSDSTTSLDSSEKSNDLSYTDDSKKNDFSNKKISKKSGNKKFKEISEKLNDIKL